MIDRSNINNKGYKLLTGGNQGGPKTKLTDEQVLSIRSRHEFDEVTKKQLLDEYPDLSEAYMRALLEYRTRSKLIPRRRA